MKSCSKDIRQLTICGNKPKCTVNCPVLTISLRRRPNKSETPHLQKGTTKNPQRNMIVPWELSRASRRKTSKPRGGTRKKSAQFFGRKHNSSGNIRKLLRLKKHTRQR